MYLKIRIFLVKNIVIDRRTLKCEGCLLNYTMKGLKMEMKWSGIGRILFIFIVLEYTIINTCCSAFTMNKAIVGVHGQKLKYPFMVSSSPDFYCQYILH